MLFFAPHRPVSALGLSTGRCHDSCSGVHRAHRFRPTIKRRLLRPYTSLYLNIYGMGGPHKISLTTGAGGYHPAGQIADGYGAGSHADDGVLSHNWPDCSGFISRCWETPKARNSHPAKSPNWARLTPSSRTQSTKRDLTSCCLIPSLGRPSLVLRPRGDRFERRGSTEQHPGATQWLQAHSVQLYLGWRNTLDGLSQPIQVSSYPYSDERNTLSSNFELRHLQLRTGEG